MNIYVFIATFEEGCIFIIIGVISISGGRILLFLFFLILNLY